LGVAKPLHLRLFLEGLEVPVISAQVSIGINGPASAVVQIIPHDKAVDFKPRTMVHLFYLDDDVSSTVTKNSATKKDVETVSVRLGQYRYKLLFGGEIISFQTQQTPASKAHILQCIDFSSYWDQAHATAIEYGPGGNAFTDTGWFVGSNTAQFDDIANQQANQIMNWLGQKPKTPGLTTVTGLAGGVIRILEAIGGLPGKERGVNDFFTIGELRCRILEQIVAEENDSTAHKLLAAKVMDEWIRNGLQNAGQQVTFRDLLGILFQYIFYETIPNPSAMFIPSVAGTKKTVIDVYDSSLLKNPVGTKVLKELKTDITKYTNLFGSGKDDASKLQEYINGAKKALVRMTSDLSSIPGQDSSDVQSLLQIAKSAFEADVTKTKAAPTYAIFADHAKRLGMAAERLEKPKETSKKPPVTKERTVLVDSQSMRLNSQILRPDCWFSAPPLCNVIFPEQYASFNYQRSFLGEVTRVLIQLYDTLVGPDKLLSNKIIAPNFKDSSKRIEKFGGPQKYRILMDHEVHTGILPRDQMLPNTGAVSKDSSKAGSAERNRISWAQRIALFHFYKLRYATRSGSVAGRFNPGVVCGFPAAILTRAFVPEERFLSDQKSAQSRLIYAIKNSEELEAPIHYVGMVRSVSHSIDQRGGMTNISMNTIRQIGGADDEFIKLAQAVKDVEREVQVTLDYAIISTMAEGKQKTDLLKYMVGVTPQPTAEKATNERPINRFIEVNWITNPSTTDVTGVGPDGKTTTTPISTKKIYTTDKTPTQPAAPQPLTSASTYRGSPVIVPRGTTSITVKSKGVGGNGTVKLVQVIDPTLVSVTGLGRLFRKVIIHQSIMVPLDDKIPAEEIIRPRGWFSDKYANEAIGREIYRPFFGCGSVVDQLLASTGVTAPATTPTTSDGDIKVDASKAVNMVPALSTQETDKIFHSIERSMSALAYVYGKVRAEGGDTDAFVRALTHRPIATMEEILGTDDLKFNVKSVSEITVEKGQIGFFSHAVNEQLINRPDNERLFGLLSDPSLKVKRLGGSGESLSYLGAYDVRKEKWEAVKAYQTKLIQDRAFRG
jgi:hypothetical protein